MVVDSECIYASNPFHQCAEYCTHRTQGRLRRAISGILNHQPRLSRAKTEIYGERIEEGDAMMERQRCIESAVVDADEGKLVQADALDKENGEGIMEGLEVRRKICVLKEELIESSEQSMDPRAKPRLRGISSFRIRRTPRLKPQLDRTKTDHKVGERRSACSADYCSYGSTETRRPKEKAESVSVVEKNEGNIAEEVQEESREGLLHPSQLPPLDPIRREDSPSTSVAKQRAGWSIVKACMERIHECLIKDPIDHKAIEIHLASMEKTEEDTRYSFENWRAAVRKLVTDAKRFETEGNTDQLKESIMVEREKSLAEAQMSLNDEQIQLSKSEKAVRDQMEVGRMMVAEIDRLGRECSRLRKQLVVKERGLDAMKKELKVATMQHTIQLQGLVSKWKAVSRREDIVREAGAALEMVEADAVTEHDRLRTILGYSIVKLLEFEIGHPHLDFN